MFRSCPICCRSAAVLLALAAGALLPGAVSAAETAAADNPYLADARLSRAELGEFIERMQTKPESLRRRPGFVEAVLDAADRIWSENGQDDLGTRALVTKLSALHYLADHGNADADRQLTELAGSLGQDKRPPVVEAVRFYLLERQALDADALAPADLAPLLDGLRKYCQAETLDERHLRLASATVRIINRLPDDKVATAAYRDFGEWFAKSENIELAGYGRKIQKGPPPKPPADKPAETPPQKAE